MRCECCDAALTLEDEFCPYCGALNAPARKHIQDMRQYERDYAHTKKEVLDSAARQSKRHSRVIAVGILVALNLVFFGLQFASYDIAWWAQGRQIHAKADTYQAQLSEMESAGDFDGLYRLYSYQNLEGEATLKNFSAVAEMARDYSRVSDSVYYLTSGHLSYNTPAQLTEDIGRCVADFYGMLGRADSDSTYYQGMFTEEHLAAMKKMQIRMEALLQSGCNLTESDIQKLPEKDSQSIMVLIGKRMGVYDD